VECFPRWATLWTNPEEEAHTSAVDRRRSLELLTAPVKTTLSPAGLLRICAVLLFAGKTALLASSGERLDGTGSGDTQGIIVVMGDSLTAGYGLDLKEAYPALLQEKIQKQGWNYQVVNAGISGDTSAGGARRIGWLLRRPLDMLILELGANDGLRGIPVETTKKNLQTIIMRTREKYPEALIILAGQKMPPNMGEAYGREFESIFSELAREQETLLIPFLLEGVGGIPELNLPDQVHPTAEGQKILAENVWKILQPALERRSVRPGQ
jgi:acyl-CoA thioesterase I